MEMNNKIPPCSLYSKYLDLIIAKLSITVTEARNRYGLFTIKQWDNLLNK